MTDKTPPAMVEDPLANLEIPSEPIPADKLREEMEKAEARLKPFRTPVTQEVLNAIIG